MMFRFCGCKNRVPELYEYSWFWAGSILWSLGLQEMVGVKVESSLRKPCQCLSGREPFHENAGLQLQVSCLPRY